MPLVLTHLATAIPFNFDNYTLMPLLSHLFFLTLFLHPPHIHTPSIPPHTPDTHQHTYYTAHRSWRVHFSRTVAMKFNCFFLMPFLDDFPTYLVSDEHGQTDRRVTALSLYLCCSFSMHPSDVDNSLLMCLARIFPLLFSLLAPSPPPSF
jgi:hypothetical protein